MSPSVTFLAHPHSPMWKWAWAELPAAALARRGMTTQVITDPAARARAAAGATVVTTLDHPVDLLRDLMEQGPFVAIVNDDIFGDMTAMAMELGMDPKVLQLGQQAILPLVAKAHAV